MTTTKRAGSHVTNPYFQPRLSPITRFPSPAHKKLQIHRSNIGPIIGSPTKWSKFITDGAAACRHPQFGQISACSMMSLPQTLQYFWSLLGAVILGAGASAAFGSPVAIPHSPQKSSSFATCFPHPLQNMMISSKSQCTLHLLGYNISWTVQFRGDDSDQLPDFSSVAPYSLPSAAASA